MKQTDIDMLEREGWIVECESPFEISLEDDPQSRATGHAADIVFDDIRNAYRLEKMEQKGFTFLAFRHILAMITENKEETRTITIDDLAKELPVYSNETISNFLRFIAKQCVESGFCNVVLDPKELYPIFNFEKPTLKQLTTAIWLLQENNPKCPVRKDDE